MGWEFIQGILFLSKETHQQLPCLWLITDAPCTNKSKKNCFYSIIDINKLHRRFLSSLNSCFLAQESYLLLYKNYDIIQVELDTPPPDCGGRHFKVVPDRPQHIGIFDLICHRRFSSARHPSPTRIHLCTRNADCIWFHVEGVTLLG